MGNTNSFGEERVTVEYKNLQVTDQLRIDTARILDDIKKLEDLYKTVDGFTGEQARLFALAYTGYEEALMWAIKAINK